MRHCLVSVVFSVLFLNPTPFFLFLITAMVSLYYVCIKDSCDEDLLTGNIVIGIEFDATTFAMGLT